jgi:hypothetical protein
MPHDVSTIQSVRTELSTEAAMELFVEAANTVMNATRPIPIINADAVAEVRRGLRPRSERSCPPSAEAGQRRTDRANGRAMTGPRTATQTNTASAPSATGPTPATDNPMARNAAPSTITTVPMTARRTDVPPGRAPRTQRGDRRHFPALRAGKYAASTVTIVPTIIEMTIVPGFTTVPRRRQLEAECGERLGNTFAVPIPATTPIAEANSPVSTDSNTSERITCLRFAPIARNSAFSRVRCATVIENVL